ncbi:MAG TPA: hypothetical protein VMB79_12215, partial [Jatrophihabitans sp.]|nr:hypothetical protein [Jatrophihabitans sp.]
MTAFARPSPRSRTGFLLAAVTALLAATVTAVAWHAPAAGADSQVGGQLTANEAMQRAADWYDRGLSYSQSAYSSDLDNSRNYRRDCSGFVDMALHLGTDYNTDGIAGSSLFSYQGWASGSLTPADVRPGDVFDDTSDGHAFLFEGWAADGVHMSYYNFGGGSSGTAPPEHHTNETFGQTYVGGEITSHYRIYRYDNLLYTDASNSGVVIAANGYTRIFATDTTGSVVERYDTVNGWGWGDMNGTILTGATAVNYFPDLNEYDVYATGTNGNLYVKEYHGGGWDGSWTLIDGPSLRAGVSAMLDKYGHQHVFATGTDGAVYNIRNGNAG